MSIVHERIWPLLSVSVSSCLRGRVEVSSETTYALARGQSSQFAVSNLTLNGFSPFLSDTKYYIVEV